MKFWVEESGENRPLAREELGAVADKLGGRLLTESRDTLPSGWLAVDLPTMDGAIEAGRRLALAHRIARPIEAINFEEAVDAFRTDPAAPAGSVAFAWISDPPPDGDAIVRDLAQLHIARGATVRLREPDRQFLLTGDRKNLNLAEVVARIDRRSYERRRMPSLPFQRPVSLQPRLARAAVNLAQVGPGDRVIDPFLGTGALLLEAGLLGARLYGVDSDPVMTRGAERNLAAFHLHAESIQVADAGSAAAFPDWPMLDALVTDPPYGRASSTGGETATSLVARILPLWSPKVRPGGRIVVIGPEGPDPLPPNWHRLSETPDRVHRSLTRTFRVYENPGQKEYD